MKNNLDSQTFFKVFLRAMLESNQPNRVCNPAPEPIGQLPLFT